jgi:hypothetical protein
MSARTCVHERDVLDLVAIDQWPQRADAALQAHVAGCPLCAEVASIATAVREWGDAESVPRMPEASVVWYRAQVRARADAARAAFRPVWLAQGFALVALAVALAWFGPGSNWYASAWQSVSRSVPSIGMPTTAALPAGWGWSIGLGLAGFALLVSLVIGALKLSERSELSHKR